MTDLARLLRQLPVQTTSAVSSNEAAQAQLDILINRIATLTSALRGAPPNDAARAAARLLLADVAMVTAQFRATLTGTGEQLNAELERVRLTIESGTEAVIL